jgi:hypothetical protein
VGGRPAANAWALFVRSGRAECASAAGPHAIAAEAGVSPERMALSRTRLALGAALVLVYVAPLFWPPASAPLGAVVPADASLLQRIFPSVPASWVAVRLLALAAGAVLLTGPAPLGTARLVSAATSTTAIAHARVLALGVALVHVCVVPWAARLGPGAQTAYVLALGAPALVLALPGWIRHPRFRELGVRALPAAIVIVAWVLARLVTDPGSPRLADVVDGWRGWLDDLHFVGERKNVLTDLFDPGLPGLGGVLLLFHGAPLFESGVLPLTFRSVQVFQIASMALCAMLVAVVSELLVGRGVSAIAVAVLLFAPYTRFVTLFPGPFLAGPIYVAAVAACVLVACRTRSEAAVAALGGAAALGLTFPGAVPAVAVLVGCAAWALRRSWRELAIACATALASFAAVVVPAAATVLRPGDLRAHFRWDGLISIIDGNLLGQLPLRDRAPAWAGVSPRPVDAIVSALLAPFAHPRIAIRLWGDAIFDPVGGALIALGVVACLRSLRRSAAARLLLAVYLAALLPAFASPVDVVDVVHAGALPIPAALLAAAGFAAIRRSAAPRVRASVAAAIVAAAACVGGTLLFDVVTPRILSASSFGIMFQALRPDDASRVVVLSYGPGFVRPTRTIFAGPITAFGGPKPVGYFEYDDGDLPVDGFAAEGKDLLFWSHAYDRDVGVADAICRQWPAAVLYEIRDVAGVGRVHAARVGTAPWAPRDAAGRWTTSDCGTRRAR